MSREHEPADATKNSGRRAFPGRDRRRALVLAASLAVSAVAVYMALHPVVLARAGSLSQITAALDGWQSALLLPLPGPDRRAGHASADLLRRLDHHATLTLREVGTRAFAARQTAARRAARGVIVRSSFQVVGVRVARRFWDDDLLVDATVLSDVVRATYEPGSGTRHSLVTTTAATPVQARLRDTLGVWRIVSVAP